MGVMVLLHEAEGAEEIFRAFLESPSPSEGFEEEE